MSAGEASVSSAAPLLALFCVQAFNKTSGGINLNQTGVMAPTNINRPPTKLGNRAPCRGHHRGAMVAIAVNGEGYREILGICEGAKEDKAG